MPDPHCFHPVDQDRTVWVCCLQYHGNGLPCDAVYLPGECGTRDPEHPTWTSDEVRMRLTAKRQLSRSVTW